ncbi:MAG: sigma-70 family RNA polymerase sigma factor [Gammaproteobacteria bacterium]|nr:sigma-70 family RNA polymerase sigma factor [Gammaproteobacteria bacterium]
MDHQPPPREGCFHGADPDAELVSQAQLELPYVDTSYEKLMLRYERLMYQICRRLLIRPDDAEEVVQEVMLKVFHHLTDFEGRAKFKTWLLQIVKRECYSHYKKNKRHLEQSDQEKYIDSDVAQTTAAQNRVEREHDVNSILSRMDVEDRHVLTLRFIADLDIAEISEVLELKLSATKMRLYRAIERAKAVAESK